jgi:AcrR family transcriptional regulator
VTSARRRKTPEIRRLEIRAAVIQAATARGLDAITVREVAEFAGVAPGLIHHYFPRMDDLLAESFGAWADGSLLELSDGLGEVPPIVGLALVIARMTPDQRLWHDALSSASRYEKLRARAKDLSVAYQAHVEQLIRAGMTDGSIVCSDPESAAWRMILMLDGLVPMVFVLGLIDRDRIPQLVGPVVEHELSLKPGSFTAVARLLMERAERSSLASS